MKHKTQEHEMKFIVFKIDGDVLKLMPQSTLTEIAESKHYGYQPIIIHGGGQIITQALIENGIALELVEGIPKLDAKSIKVVVNTLLSQVNADLVEQANMLSQQFIGINGAYFPLFQCHPKDKAFGYVAEPDAVNTSALKKLCETYIPIIASLGRFQNQFYKVNADILAYKVASALNAPLIILSDTKDEVKHEKIIQEYHQYNQSLSSKVKVVHGDEPHIIAHYLRDESIGSTIIE